MDTNDLERYKTNLDWFNRFFQDIKQLLDKIADQLSPEYKQVGTTYYYPKYNFVPSIPAYHLMGLGGENTALQIFAILDTEIIGNKDYFVPEPSLIIINHSDKDKFLYPGDYGLKVIHSSERFSEVEDGVIFGLIPGKDEVRFQAFQVPLGLFTIGQKVEDIIQERIVNVIRRLPSLSNGFS